MTDMTIEEYAGFVSHLMKQAEENGFTYETVDMSKIRTSGPKISNDGENDDSTAG